MKTLKVLLQEVVSGIKAWVNSNFAQESNAVHKTGNETVNGNKTFTGNLIHQNSRSIYRNTNISRETPPEANTAVDTYSHLGADWAYWGGLKHIWKTDGTSITELAVSNHRQVNGTWGQGFWSLQLSALKDFSNIEFIPSDNATINFGSSSKRWKNVYSVGVLGNVFETLPGTTGLVLRSTDQTWENGSRIFLYSNTHTGQTNGSVYIDVDHGDGNNTKSGMIFLPGVFHPIGGGAGGVNLGTSTFKWKTFNGVNPGSLSLPHYNEYVDKTSEIPVASLDGNTEIDINDYFPNLTGWISIVISDTSGNFIIAVQGRAGSATAFNNSRSFHTGSTGGGYIELFMPIIAGTWKTVKIQASSVAQFRFFPCIGNV